MLTDCTVVHFILCHSVHLRAVNDLAVKYHHHIYVGKDYN